MQRSSGVPRLLVHGFRGVLDAAELRLAFNPLAAVDARDWFAIRTWAALIASRLDAVPATA